MITPRDAQSPSYERARRALGARDPAAWGLALDRAGTRAVESWFLGPHGENASELEGLLVDSLRDHVFWRRNFHPGDPGHITEDVKRSPEYLAAMDVLKHEHRTLLAFLKKSVPFFSMRYQGHMNWDLTIPGIVGYFAAMLYNPNNVAFEGSTATTILELLVGDDLCRMLGYQVPGRAGAGALRPWGHVTCDGTVANIEAVWAARNLKLYPLALRAALAQEPGLAAARDLDVPVAGAPARLVELDTWTLLNLPGDVVLALPGRLASEYDVARDTVTEAVGRHAVQAVGLHAFAREHLGEVGPLAFCVPGTKHYSFPKAAALLGLGAANMLDVPVDLDARQSVAGLRAILERCLAERRPVLTVVAVVGTTEESAVDPVRDILALREEMRALGLEFTVHADAAWGGYHASVVREDFPLERPAAMPPPALPLSQYVSEQFAALGGTDSITVDPHKSGYIPYPAGALCYRNSAMRDLVTFSAPVVYQGEAEPTVGIYGVEGSKPGAAVAAIYLSHRVIRPSRSGYGKIIGEALFSCRKLYARLVCMARPEDLFVVVPLPRLPAERTGRDPEPELALLRARIDRASTAEIVGDPEAMALLQEIGPDQNILAYAFNARGPDGTLNGALELANRLNQALYRRLSIDPGEDIFGYGLIVSTTDLDAGTYGPAFIEDYKRRLGVAGSPGARITVLRSVVMDPWVTETPAGSFIDVLEAEYRRALAGALEEVMPVGVRGY